MGGECQVSCLREGTVKLQGGSLYPVLLRLPNTEVSGKLCVCVLVI